jgi:hypothetical protein
MSFKVTSLEGIKEFPNLRTLSMELGGSQIQDLNFLTHLTNLRTLILHIVICVVIGKRIAQRVPVGVG